MAWLGLRTSVEVSRAKLTLHCIKSMSAERGLPVLAGGPECARTVFIFDDHSAEYGWVGGYGGTADPRGGRGRPRRMDESEGRVYGAQMVK